MFCGGSFFKMFLSSLENYIQIKHNRKYLLHINRLCHNLGFKKNCHSRREIAKEQEKIKINKNVL